MTGYFSFFKISFYCVTVWIIKSTWPVRISFLPVSLISFSVGPVKGTLARLHPIQKITRVAITTVILLFAVAIRY